MNQYLIFDNEAEARRRNRELMSERQDPTNAKGDGKPLVTIELYALRTAKDGTAVLEVKDATRLTADERRELVDVRPSKFDPPEDEDLEARVR